MSSPIPPIVARFTGNVDDLSAAAAQLVSRITGVTRATKAQSAEAAASARITADMAGRFRAAAQAVDPFGRGLLNVKNQEVQAAQAAATLTKAIDPIAAKMAQAASGTEKFAAGLRAMKTQQEAAQVGQAESAGTLLGLEGAAGLATKALGALGIGFGAVQIAGFVSDSIEAAARLHDLAQATGASVETLSILEFAGKRNGITADDLATSFRFLANAVQNLKAGVPEAVKSFAALGLSWQDLDGLTPDQQFLKVANAIAALPDGLGKAAAANDVFGRSGAELIPLLNELAGNGFARVAAEARRYNAVISKESADAADAFRDSIDDLKGSLAGLARELVGPLLPPLTKFIELAREAAALSTFTPTSTVARALGPQAAPAPPSTLTNIGHRAAQLPTLPLDKEIQALATLRDAGTATEKDLARIREIVAQLNTDLGNTASLEKRAEITKQIASLTKQEHTAREQAAQSEERQLEIAIARRQLEAVAAARGEAVPVQRSLTPDKIATAEQADLQKVIDEFNKKALDLLGKLVQAQLHIVQAIPGTEPLSNSEQAARTLENRRGEVAAQVRAIQDVRDEAIDAWQNIGQSLRESVAGVLDALFIDGKVDLESFLHAATAGLQKIIDQLIAAKAIGGLQSLVTGGIPAAPTGLAEQNVGQLAGLAPTFGAPGQAAGAAAEAAAALRQAGAVTLAAGAALSDGGRALERGGGVVVGAGAGLRGGASDLEKAGVTMFGAAQAIKAAAAELAAANAISAIPGAPGGLDLGDLGKLAGLAPAGFAQGGLAASGGGRRGPGDRLLAWFDPLEFIVNPDATRRHLPLLRALNAGEDVPGFSDGGLVGDFHPSLVRPALAGPAISIAPPTLERATGARHQLAGELRVHLEQGLLLDTVRSYLRTGEGEELMLRAVARNPNTVRNALDHG